MERRNLTRSRELGSRDVVRRHPACRNALVNQLSEACIIARREPQHDRRPHLAAVPVSAVAPGATAFKNLAPGLDVLPRHERRERKRPTEPRRQTFLCAWGNLTRERTIGIRDRGARGPGSVHSKLDAARSRIPDNGTAIRVDTLSESPATNPAPTRTRKATSASPSRRRQSARRAGRRRPWASGPGRQGVRGNA